MASSVKTRRFKPGTFYLAVSVALAGAAGAVPIAIVEKAAFQKATAVFENRQLSVVYGQNLSPPEADGGNRPALLKTNYFAGTPAGTADVFAWYSFFDGLLEQRYRVIVQPAPVPPPVLGEPVGRPFVALSEAKYFRTIDPEAVLARPARLDGYDAWQGPFYEIAGTPANAEAVRQLPVDAAFRVSYRAVPDANHYGQTVAYGVDVAVLKYDPTPRIVENGAVKTWPVGQKAAALPVYKDEAIVERGYLGWTNPPRLYFDLRMTQPVWAPEKLAVGQIFYAFYRTEPDGNHYGPDAYLLDRYVVG